MEIVKGDRPPASFYDPRFGAVRALRAGGKIWYDARTATKALWYKDPVQATCRTAMINFPGGQCLCVDTDTLRGLVEASPAPPGLAGQFWLWVTTTVAPHTY